jgi:hypothetical protein
MGFLVEMDSRRVFPRSLLPPPLPNQAFFEKTKVKNDEIVKSTNNESLRAKRSNLIAFIFLISLDCFVAALLAMTRLWTFYGTIKIHPPF